MIGALPSVPKDAITWSKFIIYNSNIDHNYQMKMGLNYAVNQKPRLSLVHYMIAAETGSELAAFNAGHLIRELSSFTKKARSKIYLFNLFLRF
jgi:hypothetical protein